MLSRTSRAVVSAAPSLRLCHTSVSTTSAALQFRPKQSPVTSFCSTQGQRLCRSLHSTPAARKGITPGSSDPTPPNPQSNRVAGGAHHVTEPSLLTDEQYHEYAEHYLNVLLGELERVQEEGSDLEAEYSVCEVERGKSSLYHDLRLIMSSIGWCPQHCCSGRWHLRSQQAASQQTNLAELSHFRPKALRLGHPG